MTHDPYQTLSGWGAFPGQTTPFGLPYNPLQNFMNPAQAFHFQGGGIPQTGQQGYPGIPGYGGINPQQLPQQPPQQLQGQVGYGVPGYGGINPQQLQLAAQQLQLAALASQGGIPQLQGLPTHIAMQNPLLASILQNPLALAQLQNPLALAQLQNPLLNPILAHQQSPYQPFGQFGQLGQFGQPLQPQTFLQPQTWLGQSGPYGGVGFGGRGFQTGISPWACY